MKVEEKVFNDLLQTIINNSVDNKVVITNVSLWVSSWKKEMNLEKQNGAKNKNIMRVTAKEIIELVKRLPDSDSHIHNERENLCITNEWLCGSFTGRGFTAPTLEEAAEQLIEYLYQHIGHDSIVGQIVTESGFPDLIKVEKYCKSFEKDI